jgi:hypothetical protein
MLGRMTMLITLLSILFSFCVAGQSRAQELCGFTTNQAGRLPDTLRFRQVSEFGGRAFLDMQSCLVWRLEVMAGKPAVTVDEAMRECASAGQGGPHGQMGWRLPELAELTSLDTEDWLKQRIEFDQFKIPPLIRTDVEFWTSTGWLGRPGSLAIVQFSGRTTVVRPVGLDTKASVWCVLGYPAKGLR